MSHRHVLHRALIGHTHIGALAAIALLDPRDPTQLPPGDVSDAAEKKSGEGDSPFNEADGDEDYDDRDSIRAASPPNDPTNEPAPVPVDDDDEEEDDGEYDEDDNEGDFE